MEDLLHLEEVSSEFLVFGISRLVRCIAICAGSVLLLGTSDQ